MRIDVKLLPLFYEGRCACVCVFMVFTDKSTFILLYVDVIYSFYLYDGAYLIYTYKKK